MCAMSEADEKDAPGTWSYASARGRWVIAASVLGSGIAALDATVVGIALPRIGKDFHTGVDALQWVVSAYTMTLAAFLLIGGTLGDRFGRRRVFSVGVAWFAIASALCGLAPDIHTLIAARALQGIGGALLTPGSLAILQATFTPDDRAKAIGAWSGLGGLATAAGPLVGGYLLAIASWRWVFLINLPIAAAVLTVTARHVPESRGFENSGTLDVAGAASGVLWLSSLTYGLVEAPALGWADPRVVAAFSIAAISLAAFVGAEARAVDPMLPGGIFADRQFSATNAVTFLLYGALGGVLFLLPVSLQQVSGYTPLEAGTSLLPLTVIMLLFSPRSGRLATRIGPRLQMSLGPVVAGLGLALLVRSTDDHAYLTGVLPAVVVLGAGLATTVSPLTATAMAAAPAEHVGLASAVNNDVARAAGLIAVGVLPLATGLTGSAYLEPARFAHGFRVAMVSCGVLAAVAGLLAAGTISNDVLGEAQEPAEPA